MVYYNIFMYDSREKYSIRCQFHFISTRFSETKKNVDRRETKKTKNTVHFFVRKMREKRRENAKERHLAGGNIDPAALIPVE